MTREEILAMEPGSELNIKVAEEVMGYVVAEDKTFGYMERVVSPDGSSIWGLMQPYSEDVSSAELVVDRMLELGHDGAIYWADFGAEAICKAALLAVLERRRIKEISDEILQKALGDETQNSPPV